MQHAQLQVAEPGDSQDLAKIASGDVGVLQGKNACSQTVTFLKAGLTDYVLIISLLLSYFKC